MTAKNVPTAGDTVVPSARAERRRIFSADSRGIAIYALAVTGLAIAILVVIALA